MRLMTIALLFSLLFVSDDTYAKAQDTVVQIPIEIRTDAGLENLRSLFIPVLRDKLIEKNLSFFERAHDVSVLIHLNDSDTNVSIEIFPVRSPIIEVSSLLSLGSPVVVDIPQDEPESYIEIAADLTAAYGLYSVGQCHEANVLLEQVANIQIAYQTYWTQTMLAIDFIRGNCAIIEEDYRKALSLFEEGNDRRTEPSIGLTTNVAWTQLQIGQEGRALATMDKLISDVEFLKLGGGLPLYISAVEAHAEIYALASKYDTSLADMDEVIGLAPQTPGPYIQRGRYYLNMYEWDKSLEDFNTAIDLAPDDAEAYFQRGLLYYSVLQTGQTLHDEALADFRHYLDLAPEGPYADQAREYIDTLEAGARRPQRALMNNC